MNAGNADVPRWRGTAALVLGLAVLAVLVRVFFWAYTDRVWEDALITILHAENALDGIGLTHFKVDEPRIHGFTSPLSVLIPLAGALIDPGWGLATMRIASLAAAFATVILAGLLIVRTPGMSMPAGLVALTCGYLALEHHQILWGMAGMETQIACAILLFSALCYVQRNYVLLGIACALCILVRPDFALWTALIGAFLLFDCRGARSARPFVVTVGVAMALYLPWIVFATLYYGSPVPNTILAKSSGYLLWWRDGLYPEGMFRTALSRLVDQTLVLLGPAFGGHGSGFVTLLWNGRLGVAVAALIPVSLFIAVRERRREILLMHAFVAVYVVYYVFLVPIIFGWYVVPLSAVAILLAAHGLATLLRALPYPRGREAVAWAACAGFVGTFAWFLPTTFRTEREIQSLVEEPVRVRIGKYLRETPPHTTIGGEPLGYIGYHSRRTYYDYPGLASRRVVDFVRRSGKRSLYWMLHEIQPDYLVLRNGEVVDLMRDPTLRRWLASKYVPASTFSVPDADRRKIFRADRNIDLDFTLFRRAALLPDVTGVERLGVAVPIVGATVEGGWSERGGYTGVPDAPHEARWFGSWSGSDANTGRIVVTLPSLEGHREIGIPFLTGPVSAGLSLRLVDLDAGSTLQRIDAIPVRDDHWAVWRVTLPEDAHRRNLAIVAEDQGKEWGQWLAVAMPRTLRGAASVP